MLRYVVAADNVTPLSTLMPVSGTVVTTVVNGEDVYSLIDTDGELPNGVKFNYAVRVTFDDKVVSALGYDTITGVNNPPIAGTIAGLHLLANSYTASEGILLVVPHPSLPGVVGVLGNDSAGADSKQSSLAAVPVASGTTQRGGTFTLALDGSFTYQSGPKYSPNDTFTYRANNGTFTYTNAGESPDPLTTTVPMNSVNSGLVTVTITVSKK